MIIQSGSRIFAACKNIVLISSDISQLLKFQLNCNDFKLNFGIFHSWWTYLAMIDLALGSLPWHFIQFCIVGSPLAIWDFSRKSQERPSYECQTGPWGLYVVRRWFRRVSPWSEARTLANAEWFSKASNVRILTQLRLATIPLKSIFRQSSNFPWAKSWILDGQSLPRAQGRISQRSSSSSSWMSWARYKALKKLSRVNSWCVSMAFLKKTNTTAMRYWSELIQQTSCIWKHLITGSSSRCKKHLTSPRLICVQSLVTADPANFRLSATKRNEKFPWNHWGSKFKWSNSYFGNRNVWGAFAAASWRIGRHQGWNRHLSSFLSRHRMRNRKFGAGLFWATIITVRLTRSTACEWLRTWLLSFCSAAASFIIRSHADPRTSPHFINLTKWRPEKSKSPHF